MPGCRRWSRRFSDEWLCVDHWRLVPRDLKLLRTTLIRRWRRRLEKTEAIWRVEQALASRLAFTSVRAPYRRGERAVWRRMKRAAIERAAGI
jgi:hypothetical protein